MIVKATIVQDRNGSPAIGVTAEFSSQRTAELAFSVHNGSMGEKEYSRKMDEYRAKMQGK